MTATATPVELTAPDWAIVYDGDNGAVTGSVQSAGGGPAVAVVATAEPASNAGGVPVTPFGVRVQVANGEKLWDRAYGVAGAQASVVFVPDAVAGAPAA